MNIFNNNKIYELHLNEKESDVIYAFLTVNSYNRLYDTYRAHKHSIASDDIERKGSREQLHYKDTLNRKKDEDRIVDTIIMNQLALGLLLEHYVTCYNVFKGKDVKVFKLNSILAYELYVTICERIIAETKDYKDTKENNETNNQESLNKIAEKINILKNLNKKLYKIIGLKDLEVMESEYKKINIIDHLDFCLQEF